MKHVGLMHSTLHAAVVKQTQRTARRRRRRRCATNLRRPAGRRGSGGSGVSAGRVPALRRGSRGALRLERCCGVLQRSLRANRGRRGLLGVRACSVALGRHAHALRRRRRQLAARLRELLTKLGHLAGRR
eukprot:145635-Chlamydomonas_euryale.AAC.2